MRIIGIDPDLHSTAVAVVASTPREIGVRVESVHVLRVAKDLTGPDAVRAMVRELQRHFLAAPAADVLVVEGQRIYRGETNPASMLLVAQVAGAALAAVQFQDHGLIRVNVPGRVLFPYPHEWKGDVPKKIHHARICAKLGWAYQMRGGKEPYAVPTPRAGDPVLEQQGINPGDWKHLMDAVGLGLWGAEQAVKAAGRRAA